MLFVCKIEETGINRSIEHNVRMGGYRSIKSAQGAAKKNKPAIVRDEHRNIVAQTISSSLPLYLR
jgi:hypothetical protein